MESDSQEESSFDIIEYPLKHSDEKIPFFIKLSPLRYEFRIMDTVDSKRIYACKKRKNKDLFLHLRIEDNDCNIMGSSTSFYEFTNSCDFFLEQTKSTEIYNSLTSKLLTGSLNDLLNCGNELMAMVETNTLPTYTPLVMNSTLSDSINLNIMPVVLPEHCCYKINYEDEIPTECREEYVKRIKNYIREDKEWLDQLFNQIKLPIVRITQILKEFKKFCKENDHDYSLEKVKKALPLYRYLYCDGPWRKSWVLYGIDPKKDKLFYKYQIVDLRNEGVFCTLLEREAIIKEVEEHEEWYLKDDCDKKNGFFKKTLEQLVLYHNYVEISDDEEDELEFDLCDF